MVFEEEKSRLPLIVLVAGIVAATVALTLFISGRVSGPVQSGQERAGSDAVSTIELDESDTTIPITAPETTWSPYYERMIPSSPTAGPAEVDGSVSRGFAHTPTGALMAAARISTILSNATDWESVLAENVVPGEGVEAYRALREELDAQTRDLVCSTNPPGDENCSDPDAVIHRPSSLQGGFTGFKFESYSDTEALIGLRTEVADAGSLHAFYGVVWVDGDWKLQLRSTGGYAVEGERNAPPVDGLVQWGPDFS